MFSVADRTALRDALVVRAEADPRITAAALVGSAAGDAEDEWSDIDLAVRLAIDAARDDVVGDWTSAFYGEHDAVSHLDVWSGPALYRVFLLRTSLQVDVSFCPDDAFAAAGGAPFRLLFGTANEPKAGNDLPPDWLLGMGWLYALHARSSIARGRPLQALHMVNCLRDHAVALACVRHGLPEREGRGADDLPPALVDGLAVAVVDRLDLDELARAFAVAADLLLDEARYVDADAAARLEEPIRELVRTAQSSRS